MQTEDSQKVVRRFFEALYRLKDDGKIRGKQTFTREFDINRWNLNKLEKNLASDIFQPAWLTYIVKEYKVSARWLLTGEDGGKAVKLPPSLIPCCHHPRKYRVSSQPPPAFSYQGFSRKSVLLKVPCAREVSEPCRFLRRGQA